MCTILSVSTPLPEMRACFLNTCCGASLLIRRANLMPPYISPASAPVTRTMGCGKKIKNCKLDANTSFSWVSFAALDAAGCRQLQARLATTTEAQRWAILRALRRDVGFKTLYRSPHGNHVLQRLIECTSPAALEPILADLEPHFFHMCRHECHNTSDVSA